MSDTQTINFPPHRVAGLRLLLVTFDQAKASIAPIEARIARADQAAYRLRKQLGEVNGSLTALHNAPAPPPPLTAAPPPSSGRADHDCSRQSSPWQP